MKMPFQSNFYVYKIYVSDQKRPIAKFRNHSAAERFVKLIWEQEKQWRAEGSKTNRSYRVVFKNKTILAN